MKQDIHPDYKVTAVQCSCGVSFETRSTVDSLHVDICSQCHPFYTGKQKLVDTGGRVERFKRRYGQLSESTGPDGSESASSESTDSEPASSEPASS